jgi:predicted MPP superfamily phosphohydrolase
MSKKLVLMICSTLLFYILVHWYTGSRLWQLLSPLSEAVGPVVRAVFFALGLAYPLGRLANLRLPGRLGDTLIIIGSYWLGALFYAFLLLLLFDGIYILDRYLSFLPEWIKSNQPSAGVIVIAVSLATVIVGVRNARDIVVRQITLSVAKPCPINPLTIISVSDIHLGLLVGVDRLQKLITLIQQHNPDLIMFPGDIIDETAGVFADERMADELRRLSPRFGVYSCLGNHEYIWGGTEKSICQLTQAGIRILRDEYTVINDSFIVVGRDDLSRRHYANPRKELVEILQDVDRSLPLLLLDHTPEDLIAGPKCGVDLQLFGHTHRGQMFPFNYITRQVFDMDWGYKQQGQCHTFISSGFGTWGPPLRIGSKAEVLYITLKFLSTNKE